MTQSQKDTKVVYKQCRLTRANETTHTWLPEKFAKRGKVVKIRDRDSEWSDGWKVTQVGKMRLLGKVVNIIEDVHKRTRKHSDI